MNRLRADRIQAAAETAGMNCSAKSSNAAPPILPPALDGLAPHLLPPPPPHSAYPPLPHLLPTLPRAGFPRSGDLAWPLPWPRAPAEAGRVAFNVELQFKRTLKPHSDSQNSNLNPKVQSHLSAGGLFLGLFVLFAFGVLAVFLILLVTSASDARLVDVGASQLGLGAANVTRS